MPKKQLFLLAIIFTVLQQENLVVGSGYHYEHPITAISGPEVVHGHQFIPPLSTIVPLPPVPALPALPTPRPPQGSGRPISPPAPSKLIASAYLPAPHAIVPSKIYTNLVSTIALSPPVNHQYQPPPPPPPSASGSAYLPPTSPALDNIYYAPKGRPLKQYAVVEIIDNDIEQGTEPFLPTGYFDGARAQISASGTGASASEVSKLRIGALPPQQQQFLQQQQQQAQQGFPTAEAVSLGSGGLGYIRLPNGNVYLGSGSLGYISSQQHQQLLRDVRTRSEAALPDPLHFGHGPLGGNNNGFRFK